MSDPPAAHRPKPSIPGWAWIFIVCCILIPVLTLGGLIPGAIGGGGAAGCAALSRNPSRSTRFRVGLCLAVTIGCWAMLIAFAIIMAMINAAFVDSIAPPTP